MQKVLIIDDEQIILLSLKHLFSGDEVNVCTCSTAEEAEEALTQDKFNLVLTDIRLSGSQAMEGLEILSQIKKGNPETPVIVMTAFGSPEMETEAYRRGASHYFEKPIDLAKLAEKVGLLGIDLSRRWGTQGCN